MRAPLCKHCINTADCKVKVICENTKASKCYWCDETEVKLYTCDYNEEEEERSISDIMRG